MSNVPPRKIIIETVERDITFDGSLGNAKTFIESLIMQYGDQAILQSGSYDEYGYYVQVTREETDLEYNARLEKAAKAKQRRKESLDRKTKTLAQQAAEKEEAERQLYETLRKKYEERQADG